MYNQNLYVDIHVIQTVPPSCINRDDTGSPKTARYGGVTRARVSSQCWKHAMREMFPQVFSQEELGKRTKRAAELVKTEILALDAALEESKAAKMATDAMGNAGISCKKDDLTDALLFLSAAQARALAALAVHGEKDKAEYKKALRENPSIDMALFGRMVAADPSLNWDACAHVAHSISTHEVHNEFDYFTAVDDCMPEDNSGAGHVGTMEYHSATLYRYANINVRELAAQLDADTAAVVRGFVETFVRSMPTGKQNSFANHNLPDAVYVTVRTDQPMSLANAYEEPIWSTGGYGKKSAQRLAAYAQTLYARYDAQPSHSFLFGDGLEALGKESTLPQLLDSLETAVREGL